MRTIANTLLKLTEQNRSHPGKLSYLLHLLPHAVGPGEPVKLDNITPPHTVGVPSRVQTDLEEGRRCLFNGVRQMPNMSLIIKPFLSAIESCITPSQDIVQMGKLRHGAVVFWPRSVGEPRTEPEVS